MKAREEAVRNRDAELAKLGKRQVAERNWLESQWLEPEKPGRPARHAYRITAAGRAALRAAMAPSPSSILGRSLS